MSDSDRDFSPEEYEKEAQELWGATPVWGMAHRRTGQYNKDQWKKVMEERKSITKAFARELRAGTKPSSVTAMDLAE